MQENPFIGQENRITATLSRIFRAQQREEYVKILDASSPEIEETEADNWNGGTFYYTLFLEIPIEIFASIESALSKHESEIAAKLQAVIRENGNHILNRVIIRPQLVETAAGLSSQSFEAEREQAIWNGKSIKVFISHQNSDKIAAANLKSTLSKFNIASFVAHEDIEPTLPWQTEIKMALNSMNVFVALLTSNFRNSKWTDHEVGFAVAKRALIIHVRDGQDPYGFIGETQSLSLSVDNAENLGDEIVSILMKNPQLKSQMRENLFVRLENAGGFGFACKVMKLLEKAGNFTTLEIQRIRDAAERSSLVKGAYTVQSFLASNPPSPEVEF